MPLNKREDYRNRKRDNKLDKKLYKLDNNITNPQLVINKIPKYRNYKI